MLVALLGSTHGTARVHAREHCHTTVATLTFNALASDCSVGQSDRDHFLAVLAAFQIEIKPPFRQIKSATPIACSRVRDLVRDLVQSNRLLLHQCCHRHDAYVHQPFICDSLSAFL